MKGDGVMKRRMLVSAVCLMAVMFVGVVNVTAAKGKKEAVPEIPLTADGEKLKAKYAGMLTALQAEITGLLPKIDEQKKAAFLAALEAETRIDADVKAKEAALNKNSGTAMQLNRQTESLGKATKGVEDAKEKLKQAEAMSGTAEEKAAAVKAAQELLAKSQAYAEKAAGSLKQAQEAVEKAKIEEPKLNKELGESQKELAVVRANTLKLLKELKLETFLTGDKLDNKLVKWEVLSKATPHGLAEFAQQGKEQEELLNKLLADNDLMKQMVIADGANGGKYGQAMKIYTDIQKASAKAKDDVLQRLALGISVEHAVPVAQSNAAAETNAPAFVDPVKRYLHFEKAFLAGELDPGFKDMTAWDYRNAVNGVEPDHIMAWGREMLRNYRPDHITTKDLRWRYVNAVKTEVKYGSGDQKYDRPTLHQYQNIIMNGGVCGRRAFFGRFILRSFGIPTIARPQPGHATLVHWTPDGWVINLGAGWGFGRVNNNSDVDFLAMTQARKVGKAYLEVLRAQWIGDVLGEARVFGFNAKSADTGFWNNLALCRQQQIITESKAVALAAVGTDIGEANESKEKDVVEEVVLTDEDKAVVTDKDGIITIPAVACTVLTNSPGKILFMKSNLGGKQMHYSRNGTPADFEYTFQAPSAGKYALTARVVTTSADQHLLVAANDAREPVDIAVPFTIGMWDKTPPVEIPAVKGKNVLRFSRGGQNIKGLTIKDFTLKPVK